MTVLVIAPHPDDEVLGCGGSIVRHAEAGRIVHVLYLTSGEHGSPQHAPEQVRQVREREAVDAARVLGIGVSGLHFARFPDGGIQPSDLDQVGVVVRLLRTVPDAVFHPEMIGAFFAFFAGRSLDGGLAWAVRMWREFVQDGQVYSLTVTEQPPRDDREQAWQEGLRRGAQFLTEGIHPGRSRKDVLALLARIGQTLGHEPLRPW